MATAVASSTAQPSLGHTKSTPVVTATRALPQVTLRRVDLNDPEQYEILREHRIKCGWNYESEALDKFREEINEDTKCLFWIYTPASISSVPPDSDRSEDGLERIGHISLDSIAEHPDPDLELAKPDKSLLTISTFFILKEHRSGGVGRAAMEAAETLARIEPYGSRKCTAIAINTPNRKYVEDEEWRERFFRWFGFTLAERGRSNEDWYVRMGYVKWKEEPRYEADTLNGEKVKIVASYLRKELV